MLLVVLQEKIVIFALAHIYLESVIFQLLRGCREITPNCFHWGRVEKVKHPVLAQGAY